MLTHLTAGMLLRRSLPRASGHTSRGVLTPAPLKPTKCTQRLVANTRVTRYGRPAAALYICNRYQLTCTFLPHYGRTKFCHPLPNVSRRHRVSHWERAFHQLRAPRSRLDCRTLSRSQTVASKLPHSRNSSHYKHEFYCNSCRKRGDHVHCSLTSISAVYNICLPLIHSTAPSNASTNLGAN